MPSRTAVEGVLTGVRPLLAAAGGAIQLVGVAQFTRHVGLETPLRRLGPSLRVIQVA